MLEEYGIRLISVERPGLGESSPAAGRTLLDWADDVRQLGLTDPAVVGFSQGAPFARDLGSCVFAIGWQAPRR
ncbi:alpha/beta fold hydrolase [Nocardia fusca]|uniref:alpha/beta fold hydrolase n=1 Tax=Nocardia fusca TaxID=941183 RepID=UPI0037C6472B